MRTTRWLVLLVYEVTMGFCTIVAFHARLWVVGSVALLGALGGIGIALQMLGAWSAGKPWVPRDDE